MKITTIGVLLRNAEVTATSPSTAGIIRPGCILAAPIHRAMVSSAPVCTSPSPTTSSASTEISAGLPKPRSKAAGSSAPSSSGKRENSTRRSASNPAEVSSRLTHSVT